MGQEIYVTGLPGFGSTRSRPISHEPLSVGSAYINSSEVARVEALRSGNLERLPSEFRATADRIGSLYLSMAETAGLPPEEAAKLFVGILRILNETVESAGVSEDGE